jgi:hypothetical protein
MAGNTEDELTEPIEKEKDDKEEKSRKDNPKKKRKKKLIYLSIFIVIIIIALAMTLFSIHVNKPSVSKVSEYSQSTFIYEVEYYLVELGFYKLHAFFEEPPLVEIMLLEKDKTISALVQENSLVMSDAEREDPDISIYTYENIIKSLREADSKVEIVNMVKRYIKNDKIVIVPHKQPLKLALKGYLSLAYLL